MTQLLEQAISRIHKLPPKQQDALASLILEELNDEQRWKDAFANSQKQLAKMAEKVRSNKKAGKAKPGGFDQL